MNQYEIGGQIIALNWDSQYIHKNMDLFQCNEHKHIDLSIDLIENYQPDLPDQQPLIKSDYFTVYALEYGYLFIYNNLGIINACCYNEQTHKASICLTVPLKAGSCSDSIELSDNITLDTIDFIFLAMRDVFFVHAQSRGMLAVHSSSIIYNEKAYLFSASSGTGKTTHTNMWVDRFGVDILDGDVTLICLEDNIPIAYGLPWCGTSGKYLNRKVKLGGIIFLTQSCHNSVSNLTFFEAVLRCSARCFTPTWTKELSELNLTTAEKIVPKILCCILACLPDQEAVTMIKNYIDSKQ